MTDKFVLSKKEDDICYITIDRPPMNALNKVLMMELISTFSELKDDKDLRVVILTGKGDRAFVAGADISEVRGIAREEAKQFSALGQETTNAICSCHVPVLCAINGLALGGGCELALACDIRIMSENALIGLPEVTLGVLPGAGGTQRLPKIIPPGIAKLLLFSGEPISAHDAHKCGLVEKVVLKRMVMDTSIKLAQKIAANGPLAIRALKRLIVNSADSTLEEGLRFEQEEFAKLCSSKDKEEGINAFFEKRKPRFRSM